MMRNIRHAIRNLRKTPGFTIAAICTLALGIGANSAMFTIANGVLGKYPFPNPDRIVFLPETVNGEEWGPASIPDFRDWQAQSHSFSRMAMFSWATGLDFVGGPEPRRLSAARVTDGLMDVLGVAPERGRFFTAADIASKSNVVLISHVMWQDTFGNDAAIVGRSIRLSGEPYTVIGVMPKGFRFPSMDLWLPERMDEPFAPNRGSHMLPVIARLKPGVTVAQAQAEMDGIAKRLEYAYPADNTGRGVRLIRLEDRYVSGVRSSLYVLLGCVGFVLLIACANVSSLVLARGSSRAQEVAVRSALGATRARLVRQFLAENTIIALAGGALGLLLAGSSVRMILAWAPASALPRKDHIAVDGAVLWFTLAVSLFCPLIFGLVPALRGTQLDLAAALKDGNRSGTSNRTGFWRDGLIISEYALAIVLLVGSGLMLKTFLALRSVDLGFRPEHVIALELHQDLKLQAELLSRPQEIDRMLARVRQIPSVSSATQAMFLPFGYNVNSDFRIAGQPEPPQGKSPVAEMRFVDPDYFRTIGTPLLQGRDIADRDTLASPKVALINREMAGKFFPGQNPIGHRIGFQDEQNRWVWWQVIGVAGDARNFGVTEPVRYEVYMPIPQQMDQAIGPSGFDFATHLVVRTIGDPESITPALREIVHQVNPEQPIAEVATLDQIVAESMAQPRFESTLLSIFAGIALLLAAAGLYALISYSVSQRTREIGIRVALGADSRNVVWLVLRKGAILVGIGTACGIVLAVLLSRFLESMLFHVKPLDPVVYAVVTLLLILIATLATAIPAVRAARVDPTVALRYE